MDDEKRSSRETFKRQGVHYCISTETSEVALANVFILLLNQNDAWHLPWQPFHHTCTCCFRCAGHFLKQTNAYPDTDVTWTSIHFGVLWCENMYLQTPTFVSFFPFSPSYYYCSVFKNQWQQFISDRSLCCLSLSGVGELSLQDHPLSKKSLFFGQAVCSSLSPLMEKSWRGLKRREDLHNPTQCWPRVNRKTQKFWE